MMEFMKNYRGHEQSVPFPLYETSELDTDVSSKWAELVDINFKYGATFLAETDLDVKHIPGVLAFFASLAKFEDGKKTEWVKDAAMYDSLPALLIKFANNSRVDSGHRLLMRCIRHAMDSRTPSLDDKVATLILHEGDVGIQLTSPMPASMKSKTYTPSIV